MGSVGCIWLTSLTVGEEKPRESSRYNTATNLDHLSFKLKAEVMAQMGDFTADWNEA